MLKFAYRLARTLTAKRSQSNEAGILLKLSRGVSKTFVEFGFPCGADRSLRAPRHEERIKHMPFTSV